MAKATPRVSVVRISRLSLNQINRKIDEDDPDKTIEKSYFKQYDIPHPDGLVSTTTERNDIPMMKTDLSTNTNPKKTDNKNDYFNRQSSPTGSLHSPIAIQRQPAQIDTWIKPSVENKTRPHSAWKATGQWNHDLYSLFDDRNMCCYACSCWCCFRHELSSMMNEHWSIWFVSCSPLMALRTKFRQQYAIQGSIAQDFCYSTCCPLCVALQLANEARDHGHRIFS